MGWIQNIMAAVLTPTPLPKAPKAPQSYPGYRTRVTASASAIPKGTTLTATQDRLLDAKQKTNDYQTIKALTKNSPELSGSVSMLVRTAITDSYTIVGRDLDGVANRDATALAHELLRRLTFMGNADGSFGNQQTIQSLSETLCMDLMHTGAACVEVALDKARIPASLNPIAVSTLEFLEEENSFKLQQKIGGTTIPLDIPTVIYVALDQVPTDAYATSPLTSAIQPILSDLEFNNDMRRALKRAVLPRLSALIDSEKVKKLTPPEILADPEEFTNYQNSLIAQIEGVINGLNPEDALVSFDMVAYAYIDGGHDPSAIIERVQKVLNSKLVSGSRAMPVALGYASTSNASSAESMLFLKQADGLRKKLNELYSRAMTVAVRLMGVEGYVEFTYAPPDLRPSLELEAFRAMHQSRVLELLSLGLVTDDEACLELTGRLSPMGMKPLSGTMFKAGSSVAQNPTSNTSATERALKPASPTEPKSSLDPSTLVIAAQTAQAQTTAETAIKAMQDLAMVVGRQKDRPVNLNVSQQPIELTLNQPKAKKVTFTRDAEGRLTGMEAQDD